VRFSCARGGIPFRLAPSPLKAPELIKVLACFLDFELVALDKFGDQLRKRKAAIVGHFDSGLFHLDRDVKIGLLALAAGCHMAQAVRHIYAVNKIFLFCEDFF
jgi:hypothetical protein